MAVAGGRGRGRRQAQLKLGEHEAKTLAGQGLVVWCGVGVGWGGRGWVDWLVGFSRSA